MRRIDSTDDIADGLLDLARKDVRLARAISLSGPVPLRRKPPGYAALTEALREAGLSRAKAETLNRVGEAVIAGELDLGHLCQLEGRAAITAMTSIKGVGPWTAEVYLLFCAGHPDVFPAGDVALQRAAADILGLDARPQAKVLYRLAEEWSPWRGVAARLFWAYYAAVMRRDATPVAAG